MKKFAFVILNYLTYLETERCVESIRLIGKNQDYKIIVVDNCSPNKSGELLKTKYENDEDIDVVLLDDNIGFARGNNVGFLKAKNEYNADFILLCNNDTVIKTPNFCEKLIEKYRNDPFAVLGPKEILPNGSNYPLNNKYPTLESVEQKIKNYKQKLRARENFLFGIYYKFKKTINNLRQVIIKIFKKSKPVEKLDFNQEYKNLILHGFFLVFSRDYIDKFDGLDDRTYFYGEEDLLAIRLKENNMTSIYYPTLEVFHNHNSATNARSKNKKEKDIFVYENMIKSLEIIKDELKGKWLNEKIS